MSLDQQLVNDVINRVLNEWAIEFISIRQQTADAKLGKSSGEGFKSFDHAVVKANGSQIAEALFAFNEYLRIADMKKAWSRQPPVEVMEAWVEKKGVEKFRPKYIAKYGSAPKDITQLINKIAWGISISIRNRRSLKRKRVKWYSKSAYQGIEVLYTRLLDQLSKDSLDQLKKEVKNVSTQG